MDEQLAARVREIVERVLREQGAALAPSAADALTVALGADHGGFALKRVLLPPPVARGYRVLDCGTFSA
ncbi:MAG: hypothetical protein B6D41_13875, partial [Chloroflexi bacterium UTCFX4]